MTLFDLSSDNAPSRSVAAKIRSTPNLRHAHDSIWMCGACGLLLVHHGHQSPPGRCPSCDNKKWWGQDSPTGPFFFDHDLVHSLHDLCGLDAGEIFASLAAERHA